MSLMGLKVSYGANLSQVPSRDEGQRTEKFRNSSSARSAEVECSNIARSQLWASTRSNVLNWPRMRLPSTQAKDLAVRRAFNPAGVMFLDENGRGPEVRLRKTPQDGNENKVGYKTQYLF